MLPINRIQKQLCLRLLDEINYYYYYYYYYLGSKFHLKAAKKVLCVVNSWTIWILGLSDIQTPIWIRVSSFFDSAFLNYLMVSKKVFLSVISSGILARIFFRAADFLFSSWKGSSVRLSLYSPPWKKKFFL